MHDGMVVKVADDEMVQQTYPKELAPLSEPFGHGQIFLAGGQITRRVIVGHDQRDGTT